MTDQINVTTAGQSIDLLVTGAPDAKNRYGSGHIRPSEITLTYRGTSISAQVYGRWRRESGELTDASASQNYRSYKGDMDGWPEWLASLAREHRPAVAAPHVDRAAVRDRIAAYRSPGTRKLYCVTCARQETGWRPVTAAAVADETVCDFCGGRVLAVASRTLGEVVARYLPEPADRAALERIREVIRRLANHAVGFQDVLDDSDRDPWAKTVGADIAELRRLAAETPQPDTTAHSLDGVLRIVADWYASVEGRYVLIEDLTAAGYHLPAAGAQHAEAGQ